MDSRWERHKRHAWTALRGALVLIAIAAAVWWFRFSPVRVARHTLATGSVTAEVLGTGTLEGRTSALVGPKIGGLIAHVAVDQGDRVQAGALLFRLEDSDFEQQVAIAESEVAVAAATLERSRAAKRAAEAVHEQARTNHARFTELLASDVVSQQDLDKSLELLSVAEAELAIADAAIIEAQKRLVASERSLDYQRARLQDTTIEAPFDGLVVRRDRDPGDVVAPASAVLSVVSTEEMWIRAWVDETELARLQEGAPARVVFRSEPGIEYPGVVARIGHEADRETREIVVDVRVDRLPKRWAVGQRAEVYIHVERREGVTVLPAELLRLRDGETGVLLDDAGRARWRALTIGLRGREFLEVTDGLSPGDVVVESEDVREGRRIEGP